MAILLKCPDCTQKFRWDFAAESQWPEACPLCKAEMGTGKDENVICLPALRSAKTKVIDGSYRQLEDSSRERMYQAAEAAGCDASEMSGLQITNIKTGVKPGESYVPDVHNPVTERMDQMKSMGMAAGFSGADAANLASQVRSGPHPNAGAKTLSAIQRLTGRGR